jgi:hypothetical protein
MAIDLSLGFGAFTQGSSLLDGSEADGTNLLTGNAAMTTGWATEGGTLTTSAVLAPNGATDAATFTEPGTGGRKIAYQQMGSSAVEVARFSIYAKENTLRYLQFSTDANSGRQYAYYDLQTGTVTDSGNDGGSATVTGTSITAGANGFWKCSMDLDTNSTINGVYFQFGLSDVSTYAGGTTAFGCTTFTGAGGTGIYVWRPKLVAI